MKTNPDQLNLFDEIKKPKTECLWFDVSPTGEPCCYLRKEPLYSDKETCFCCEDYSKFVKGEYPHA